MKMDTTADKMGSSDPGVGTTGDGTDQTLPPESTGEPGIANPAGGEGAAGKPAKRRRRWLRCLIVIGLLGLLLLVLIVALLPTLLSSTPVKNTLVSAAAKALNRETTLDDLSVSWRHGLRITGLRIKEKDGEDLFSLKSLTCNLHLPALRQGGIAVEELRLVEPRAVIQRRPDGTLSIADLISASPTSSQPTTVPAETQTTPEETQTEPFVLPPLSLRAAVENGAFSFIDEKTGESLRIADLNATLDMPSINEPIKTDLNLDLSARGRTEHVSLTASAQVAENDRIDSEAMKLDVTFTSVPVQVEAHIDMGSLNHSDNGSAGQATVSCNLGALLERLSAVASLPPGLQVGGTLKTVFDVTGTKESPSITGTTELTQVEAVIPMESTAAESDMTSPREPLTLAPMDVTIVHAFEYRTQEDLLTLKQLSLSSDLAKLNVKGTAAALRTSPVVDASLDGRIDLQKISGILTAYLPKEVKLGELLTFGFTAHGTPRAASDDAGEPFAALLPWQVKGNLHLDQAEYDSDDTYAKIADVTLDPVTLENGVVDVRGTFVLNDGPASLQANVNLQTANPVFSAKVSGQGVAVDQKVALLGYVIPILILPADGTVHTSADFAVDVSGTGAAWEDMRSNLKAEGSLKLNDGFVSGGEIISAILTLLRQNDRFDFKGMDAAFALADGRISSENIKVNATSLDFAFNGWTSIIPTAETGGFPMEYRLGADLLRKYAGDDYEKYLGTLENQEESYSPLVISGTVQEPKVRLNLPKLSDAAGRLIQNALGEFLDKKMGEEKEKGTAAGQLLEQLRGDAGKKLIEGLFGPRKK